MTGPMTELARSDEVRLQRKQDKLVGFVVGATAMFMLVLVWGWAGDTLHTSDDFRYGQSFRGEADCELLAEAVYKHDLFVLSSDTSFTGWASRAEKAFFRGCDGQGEGGEGGGDGFGRGGGD